VHLRLLGTLLPGTCPVCGARAGAPCERCWRRLRPAPPLPAPEGVDVCRALLLYDGAGRELVARLKYRNARSSIEWLARGMADLVRPWCDAATAVTWAPTTLRRRRERGFDQAELLAAAVSRHLGIPTLALLRRPEGVAQTGRPAAERRGGVRFELRGSAPRTVVVVDDVITTGATLAAAAAALRNGSSTTIIAVTAARTPLKLSQTPADA